MGKRRTQREILEDIPGLEEEPKPPKKGKPEEEVAADEGPTVARKRGRPRKVKVEVEVPDEVQALIAIAPLILAQVGAAHLAGYAITYPPEVLEACQKSFAAYLDSWDVKLTPGWALLSAYGAAIAAGVISAKPIAAAAANADQPTPPPEEKEVQGQATVVKVERPSGEVHHEPSPQAAAA